MKTALTHTKVAAHVNPAAGWMAGGLAFLILLSISTPVVPEGARGVLMTAFAPLCHQIAERSFTASGVAFALCHRCLGLVVGMLAGLGASIVLARRGGGGHVVRLAAVPVALLAFALVPMAVDWGLDALRVWSNTPGSRVLTGVWGGSGLGVLLASSLLTPLEEVRTSA